jgi:glycosyltransferase involved in cell wall biosynthesis
MKVGGFTYIRNGFRYGYPFIESISSLMPLVDELVVVIGNSDDGTREAIVNLNHPKIKIIDTVWDDSLRQNGEIFAQQSRFGLEQTSGDWLFHLQVDEVLHEDAVEKIRKILNEADSDPNIDGLLFPFLHFWGDYQHIRNTRRTHRFEIRAFRNTGNVVPYKDSQGFRFRNGKKLRVIKTDVPVFHYSYTRHPRLMREKDNYFHRFWHTNEWLKDHITEADFDFNRVDRLELYDGQHPVYMSETIRTKDWEFKYDPLQSNIKIKDRILLWFEKKTGIRLFEYRNYRLKQREKK